MPDIKWIIARLPARRQTLFVSIWKFNTFRYNRLIDEKFYRDSGPVGIRASAAPRSRADDSDIYFSQTGVGIDLEGSPISPSLEINLPSEHHYTLAYLLDGEVLAQQMVRPSGQAISPGMSTYLLDVPVEARTRCNKLRLVPIPGFRDGCCRLGFLRFHKKF